MNKHVFKTSLTMCTRRWVREGDVVLVSTWNFNSDTRADIVFRYTENQAHWLRKHGYLNVVV